MTNHQIDQMLTDLDIYLSARDPEFVMPKIDDAMRTIIRGNVAQVVKPPEPVPAGWFHELLDKNGNGTGVVLGDIGPDAEKTIRHGHVPGETSEHKFQLYRIH